MARRITKAEVEEYAKLEIEGFIEDYLNTIKTRVRVSLKNYLDSNYIHFFALNLSEISSIYPQDRESEKNYCQYICRLFKENPLFVIGEIIDKVDIFKHEKTIDFNPDNNFYKSYGNKSFFIRYKLNIPKSRYLISVDSIKINILNNITDLITPVNYEVKVDYVDYFSSEVSIFIEVEFDEEQNSISKEDYCVRIELIGKLISYSSNIPAWMDHFVVASIYQQMNNFRMATLFGFIAFDSFVELMYKQIYNYTCSYSSDRSVKLSLKYFVQNLADKIKSDLRGIRTRKTIDRYALKVVDEILNDYRAIYESIIIQKNKVKNSLAKDDRRLIKEKLKEVRKSLNINTNTNEFVGIMKLLDRIKEIEKLRNNIAHGNQLNTEPNGEELYEIITYILSLIYREDFIVSDWHPLTFNRMI